MIEDLETRETRWEGSEVMARERPVAVTARGGAAAPNPAVWAPSELLDILDQLPAAVMLWDRDHVNRFATSGMAEWAPNTPDELIGRHARDVIGASAYDLNRPHMDRVMLGVPQSFERAMPRSDGSVIFTHIDYEPWVSDGQVVGFLTMATDVSRRVQANIQSRANAQQIARLSERQRVAADQDQDTLATLRAALRLLSDATPTPRTIDSCCDMLDDVISRVRGCIRDLADVVDRSELVEGIDELLTVKRASGVPVTVAYVGDLNRIPGSAYVELLNVLDAIIETSRPPTPGRSVDVTIRVSAGQILIRIVDTGSAGGADGAATTSLQSTFGALRYSADRLGATFVVHPHRPSGFVCEWRLPLSSRIEAREAYPLTVTPEVQAAPPVAEAAEAAEVAPSDVRRPGTREEYTADFLVGVLDLIPAVVTVWDTDLRNVFANAAALRWMDVPERADIIGKLGINLFSPAMYAANLSYLEAAMSGSPQQFQRTMVLSDGQKRHSQLAYVPRFHDGVLNGVVVFIYDITSYADAEETLRSNVSRLSALNERQHIAAAYHDLVNQRLYAAQLALAHCHAVDAPRRGERIRAATEQIEDALGELLSSNAALRAPAEAEDLPGAIAHIVNTALLTGDAQVEVAVSGPPTILPPAAAVALLDAVRDVAADIAHRADRAGRTPVQSVSVAVTIRIGEVTLRVADDGGAEGAALAARLRSTAAGLGGTASVTPSGAAGRIVAWQVPMSSRWPRPS
jgi:PAS domain S-box-containing protein